MLKRILKKSLGTVFVSCSVLLMVMVALGFGIALGAYRSVAQMLPDANAVESYRPQLTTKLYSSEGELIAELFNQHRELARIQEIPPDLINATVAIEDERFYNHHGLDLRALARAITANLRSGGYSQGGSTITQQLARSIFLTPKKTLSRKAQELVLSLEMERRLSKQEILELYLNQVFYGSGSYGVKVAARTYFDKDLDELTLAECALLAGLPQRPSDYSPYKDVTIASVRRNVVLRKMAEIKMITPLQLKDALEEEIKLAGNEYTGVTVLKAPYFTTYVIAELIEQYGADLVYKGGLKVHTTLSLKMQEAGEKAVRDGVARVARRNVNQGALVAIDPYTGYVKTVVGGVDFAKSQFNRATQARRQPGSAFKPIVYTAAFDNGFTPNTVVIDSQRSYGSGTQTWAPRNYDHRYRGSVSIETAIALSINTVAVKVANNIGVEKLVEYAQRMGINTPVEPYLSSALGASVLSPLELATAYCTIATDGVRSEPQCIQRVEDSTGKVLFEARPKLTRVVRKSTMEDIKRCLRAVVTRGTGSVASGAGYRAYGKTGTTSDDRDAWFAGFTQDLVCVVWVGNDDYSQMRTVYGGTGCGPIWVDYMKQAVPVIQKERKAGGLDIPDFEEPKEKRSIGVLREKGMQAVTICRDSGMLATPQCPHTMTKLFPAGKAPAKECTQHGGKPRPTEPGVKPEPSGDKPPVTTEPGGDEEPDVPVITRPEPEPEDTKPEGDTDG